MALVMSLINFIVTVYGCTTKNLVKIADNVVRALARLILFKGKYDSVSTCIRDDLKWMLPSKMCDYKSLCYMFQIAKLNQVPYFTNTNCFNPVSSRHMYETRQSEYDYAINVKVKSESARTMFAVRAVGLWNDLSPELKSEECYSKFKAKLKELYCSKKSV